MQLQGCGGLVVGEDCNFEVTLEPVESGQSVTGGVTFRDGGDILCSEPVYPMETLDGPDYYATCNVALNSPGSQTVTASYGGDANNARPPRS